MNTLRYVLVLTIICVVAGGLLSFVNEKTKGPIAETEKREKIRAIRDVLSVRFPALKVAANPDSDCTVLPVKDSENGKDKTLTFYPVRDSLGVVLGYAVKTASFAGYSGRIDFMFGMAMDGRVCGTRVLAHNETPGLGSKLENESFSGQFTGLSRDNGEIKIKKFGGTVESISGASISSHAMTSALNEALKVFAGSFRNREEGP